MVGGLILTVCPSGSARASIFHLRFFSFQGGSRAWNFAGFVCPALRGPMSAEGPASPWAPDPSCPVFPGSLFLKMLMGWISSSLVCSPVSYVFFLIFYLILPPSPHMFLDVFQLHHLWHK